MKFVVTKKDLSELAGKIQNIVSQKPAIPILSHILVEAFNDELVFTATDLTVGMRCFLEAKILEEGAFTLPAKHFFQLIRELPNVSVEFVSHANGVTEIKAGAASFKLNGQRVEDFPTLPDLQSTQEVKMEQKVLKDALYQTAFAVSREDTRYALTGVHIHFREGQATFVGTDGKRLAKKVVVAAEMAPQFTHSCIIPYKTVEEIQKMIHDTGTVTLHLMQDKVAIKMEDAILISKLLSGDYPDYQRVIPKKTDVDVELHREELISLLRQVIPFTSELHSSVRFTFQPGELVLNSSSSEVGEGVVSMPVNYHKEPLPIAFNPHFFLDILRHCKDETVQLSLIDSYNPGIIKDSSNTLYVIMPMRLQEV